MSTRCKIEEIKEVGESGFYAAYLCLDRHGAAIKVIGQNLDECITRAVFVRDTFNNAPKGVTS